MASHNRQCCVPGCSNSNQRQPFLSFHDFPTNNALRSTWVRLMSRGEGISFKIVRRGTLVCSIHFENDDLFITNTGKRTLRTGATPVRYIWNNWGKDQIYRESVHDRASTLLGVPEPVDKDVVEDADEVQLQLRDHNYGRNPSSDKLCEVAMDCAVSNPVQGARDYCALPVPAALDMAIMTNQNQANIIEELQGKLTKLTTQYRLGLQRFAGSDEDIRFYTRFASYTHLMAFWHLIEKAADSRFLRVTSTNASETRFTRRKSSLPPIDEFFLFMTHLSLGLEQKDLAHRFSIPPSTVSCIIISWANLLYCLLGSVRVWVPREAIKAHMPPEFKDYADTQVVIDCIELRCQTPSPLLLQSEVLSSHKSHCTFKGMLGMAPHGVVTFVSSLYAGSVSDKEIFKQSGIISLLTPEMAIMVDKGFLIDGLVPCKVHRPAFLSRRTQMPAHEVKETQSIARLRVHVKRTLRRVKEHKLFDTVIPLYVAGSINQIFAVTCLLVNYQNRPLVRAWAKPV